MPQTESAAVVLRDIPWNLYNALVETENHVLMAYDRGVLEIMSPSSTHEAIVEAIRAVIIAVLRQFRLDRVATASTTFRHMEMDKGFEADASFYLQDPADIRSRMKTRNLDLRVDPAPDLVVEVDRTANSLDKFPIYAAAGVSEIWRYRDEQVQIFRLNAGSYEPVPQSEWLPQVRPQKVSNWIAQSFNMPAPEWEDAVAEWASGLNDSES